MKKVKICGLPHEIVELEDSFNTDCHMRQINYQDLVIKINKDMPEQLKEETLCHEIMHGILTHLGYSDMATNEQFVQAVGNAIYQSFRVKYEGEDEPEKRQCDSKVMDKHDKWIKRNTIDEIKEMLLTWDPEAINDTSMLIEVESIIKKLDEMMDGLVK